MAALSSKDKLTLKLSKERLERWERERRKPAKNFVVTPAGKVKPVERCKGIVFAAGQDKPTEDVSPDRMDSVHRSTDGHKMRLPCGKLTLVRRGDNFSDYQDADYSESPRDPAWKANQPAIAKPRPNSPFKRAGASLSSVVVIRK